jgi:hypothetical protein
MITDTHKQVPLPLERSKGSVCVQSLDDSRELRVTLTIAVNCVLHRYKTLVIHRKASILSVVIVTEGKVRASITTSTLIGRVITLSSMMLEPITDNLH